MKKIINCLIALALSGMLLSSHAQEKKGQLWLAGIEVVKSEMLTQYMDFNKEMVALCKTENFPYSFYIWTPGDFKYYIWYPIESYNDVASIEKAWEALVAKWGADKYKKFQECLEYSEEKIMINRPDLSMLPENSGMEEENFYCWWQEWYIKKGHEKDVEALVQQGNKILSKYGTINMGNGLTGFEQSVLILWIMGKDKHDFWMKDKAFWDQLDETSRTAFKKIDDELTTHLRKIEYKDFWWVKDISYEKKQ